ncbi:hypothetical protein Pan153_42160 [Gimesia panareensis]|uniref:Uncharacterized protein n=1 Tax=Gimesia panareensis TaxID=2527978 RepID=A0A518FT97_9PLAN|nr:hypothetical protein Pan153_42160 [Gimesia panareensis]
MFACYVSHDSHDDLNFVNRRAGVKQNLCSEFSVSCLDLLLNCISVVLSLLRNDLKMYETFRTGDFYSGEKLEKSTAIQVDLSHLYAVFQCTHRPPRARSTIATIYDSGSADQVQCFQFWRQKRTEEWEGDSVKAFDFCYHLLKIPDILSRWAYKFRCPCLTNCDI